MSEEEWDICPENWIKNFKCKLINSGRWRLEEGIVFGKWLFLIDKVSSKTAPANADQRNFLSGLLEVERRNDKFRIKNNSRPQREGSLRKFRECLDKVEQDWNKEKEEQKRL